MDYGKTVAIILAVIVVMAVLVASNMSESKRAKIGKQKTTLEENIPKTAITRCINLCKDVSKAIQLNSGRCLSPDIDGYSCAVIVNKEGHCVRFFRGSKEIDLNSNCEFVGVMVWKD